MAKKKFYAVARGRKIGIFTTWSECEKLIKGYPNQDYKGFSILEEAEAWLQEKVGKPIHTKQNSQQDYQKPISSDENKAKITMMEVSTPGQKTEKKDNERVKKIEALREKIEKSCQYLCPIPPAVETYCQQYGYDTLSDAQKRALDTLEGRSLLFAVPGSGKTTVIVARTGYLLHGQHGKNIEPSSLMTLTFTRAAAAEMRERYLQKFGTDTEEQVPQFRTIHSFCMHSIIQTLRRKGENIPRYLIEEEIEIKNEKGEIVKKKLSLQKIIKDAFSVYQQGHGDAKGPIEDEDVEKLAVGITYIKNRMLEQKCHKEYIPISQKRDIEACDYFQCYEKILHDKYQAYDFDDMLIYSLKGLQKYPEILCTLQKQYHYWSIDEAQDNSPLQNELLKLLVGEKTPYSWSAMMIKVSMDSVVQNRELCLLMAYKKMCAYWLWIKIIAVTSLSSIRLNNLSKIIISELKSQWRPIHKKMGKSIFIL